jgi:D-beta-D-heptose 7-phosphate kinase/D-beta-D-heptose 1-phosphate adenosyltransferase
MTNKLKVVIVTGGFDPLHEGHIKYFKAARDLGDHLIVGVNSDDWLARKKGKPFQLWKTRALIIENLRMVTGVTAFNDSDNTGIDAITKTKAFWGPNYHYIFANGGDRTAENIPEMVVDDIEFAFGVGGDDKMNSSSWILNKWKENNGKN